LTVNLSAACTGTGDKAESKSPAIATIIQFLQFLQFLFFTGDSIAN